MTEELKQAAQQALQCLRYLKDQSDCDVDPFRWMQSKGNAAIEALNTALTTSQPAQAGEREAFEAWLIELDSGDDFTERDFDGYYVDHGTQRAWRAWQARASLPTQPAAQATPDVPEVCFGNKATPEPSHAAKMLKADVAYVEQQMAAATPEPEWRDRLTVNLLRHGSGLTKNQIRALIDYAVDGIEPDAALFTATPEPVGEPGRAFYDATCFAFDVRTDWKSLPETIKHRYALAAAKLTHPAPGVPDVLFDGFAVLQALTPQAERRTSAENVSDVLDAAVRLIRAAQAKGGGNG